MNAHHSFGRREFISRASVLAGTLALPLDGLGQARQPARPPNVLLIISDDQGWGDYSFMEHPAIQTPNIDRLASQGVLFTRGYVAAPLCCPSLAALLTGLHPHQNRITTNDPHVPKGQPRAQAMRSEYCLKQRDAVLEYYRQTPTLPRCLETLGYVSLQTGKWWGGSYSDGGFTHGMTHGDPARGGRHGDAGLAIGRQTLQPIYDFIAKAGDKPWFAWYAPIMPHLPHNPPERLLAKVRDKTDSIHEARYWAMCEWFDETCGELLEYLDAHGLAEDTLVLYICDNGWIQRTDAPRCAPRSKTSSYEGGVRTPVIVRWPGRVAPRRDDRTPVSAVDIATTVQAACRLPQASGQQGVNLLDRDALNSRSAVFGATYSHDAADVLSPEANLKSRWAIEGWWKLILPYRPNVPEAVVELYDLKHDPHEETNLASEHRDQVAAMHQRLQTWWPVSDRMPLRYPLPPSTDLDVEFEGVDGGWKAVKQLDNVAVTDGCLTCRSTGGDPTLTLAPCAIDASRYGRVRVRMAVTNGKTAQLFWGTTAERRINRQKSITVELIPDGKPHDYVFEVGSHQSWTGHTITRVRLDPTDARADIRIEHIKGEPAQSPR